MRHFQPCNHGTAREELRRVAGPVESLLLPPLPAGYLLPGITRAGNAPARNSQSQLQPCAGSAGTPTLNPDSPPSPSEQDRSTGIWALPVCQHPGTTEGCRDTRLYSSRSGRHWMGLGGRGGCSISILLGNLRIFVKKQARIWQRAEGGDGCQGLDSCTFFTSKLCDQ